MSQVIERWLVVLFFVGLLALGLAVVDDYGLSWDEQTSRLGNGLPNYHYLTTGERGPLKASGEKNHGPAFEIVLYSLERGLGLDDPRAVYLMRHGVTFSLFVLSVFVFYRVLRRRFQHRLVGLAGAAFLVVSPRIFADAFYNSKDEAFLSAYVFALASLGRFLRRPTAGQAALHALACGFLIDIRILGVVIPALTVGVMTLGQAARGAEGEKLAYPWRPLAWYLGLTVVFVTLFWPYLWHNPPGLFVRAYREMSRYPWPGTVLYRGFEVPASQLPWHYGPTWVALTTPILYLVLAVVGAGSLLARLVRSPVRTLAVRLEDLSWVAALVGPLVAVILLRSTLYDGWRHLYFLYPPLVYLATLGFAALLTLPTLVGSWQAQLMSLILAGCGLPLACTAGTMVRDHPYQNVYFNVLAGGDLQAIKQRYETDYWGLTCRAGLERLLLVDPAPIITVYAETSAVADSALSLTPRQRARLRFTDTAEGADYLASHFRRHRGEFARSDEVCAVGVGTARLFVVQRLRPPVGPS